MTVRLVTTEILWWIAQKKEEIEIFYKNVAESLT